MQSHPSSPYQGIDKLDRNVLQSSPTSNSNSKKASYDRGGSMRIQKHHLFARKQLDLENERFELKVKEIMQMKPSQAKLNNSK